MQVEWYGQSTFRLAADGRTVVIDPWADMSAAAANGLQWDYPPIVGVDADLLLVTHEHADHNGVEVIGGDPHLLRSTAGTHESPLGTVVGVASEHDDVAGSQRGPNTIFVFEFGGMRVAHFGDLGQAALRPEQRAAIGSVDLLFVPVGGGFTIGADEAHTIVQELRPRWVVPMHFRTERISFLEPVDAFAAKFTGIERTPTSTFETESLPVHESSVLVIPATP